MQHVLTDEQLEFPSKDHPSLAWIRVRDAVKLLWDKNTKLHNVGDIIQSIELYGFQDVPIFDSTLSAIKSGNGRVECLDIMERDHYELPRGLAIEKGTGNWVMPLKIGVDAESESEAIAYAIDANNIVLTGSGFSHIDMSRLHDVDAYLSLLNENAAGGFFPVTVDEQDLDGLNNIGLLVGKNFDTDLVDDDDEDDDDEDDEDWDGMDEDEGEPTGEDEAAPGDFPHPPTPRDERWPMVKARVRPDLYEIFIEITADFGEDDDDRLEGLLKLYQKEGVQVE